MLSPPPGPVPAPPRLSVITVTHGRHELLRRKAEALSAQTLPPAQFEWCVVANGDQVAADLLEALELPFTVRWSLEPVNIAIGAARNHAVQLATAELLLMSDDDVLPGPGCLAAHLAAHAAGRRLAAELGRVVVGELRLPEILRDGREREPFERTARLGGRALWINATGANTSLPRAAFALAGGYDETFAGYGGEDSDLALRLARVGFAFVRSGAAWAEHHGRVLPDAGKAYLAGKAGVRVWRKHGGTMTALMLGVHPLQLSLKRLLLGKAVGWLIGPETRSYELAYARGASDELAPSQGPPNGAGEGRP